MTDKKSQDDKVLQDVFDVATRDPEMQADPAFLARMSAMAASEARLHGQRSAAAPKSLGARILNGVGGWGAVAGLATATVAGIWIGVGQPDAVMSFGLEGTEISDVFELGDLLPGYGGDLLQEEG